MVKLSDNTKFYLSLGIVLFMLVTIGVLAYEQGKFDGMVVICGEAGVNLVWSGELAGRYVCGDVVLVDDRYSGFKPVNISGGVLN